MYAEEKTPSLKYEGNPFVMNTQSTPMADGNTEVLPNEDGDEEPP